MLEEKDKEKEVIIDATKRVLMVATKEAPYHKEGEEFWIAPKIAEIMIKNKWAKKVSD